MNVIWLMFFAITRAFILISECAAMFSTCSPYFMSIFDEVFQELLYIYPGLSIDQRLLWIYLLIKPYINYYTHKYSIPTYFSLYLELYISFSYFINCLLFNNRLFHSIIYAIHGDCVISKWYRGSKLIWNMFYHY